MLPTIRAGASASFLVNALAPRMYWCFCPLPSLATKLRQAGRIYFNDPTHHLSTACRRREALSFCIDQKETKNLGCRILVSDNTSIVLNRWMSRFAETASVFRVLWFDFGTQVCCAILHPANLKLETNSQLNN